MSEYIKMYEFDKDYKIVVRLLRMNLLQFYKFGL